MPIYEFRCNRCQRKANLFLRSITTSVTPVCPACGSSDLVRIISSFAYHKSEKARLEEVGEPQRYPSPDYYENPRNIGRWTEKRLKEMGIDMYSEEHRDTFSGVGEMIAAARDGDMSLLEKKSC